MNILALDCETTTYHKGHPFDPRNKLVCWSFSDGTENDARRWPDPSCQSLVNQAERIVGFNIKFDLQWLVKEGITYTPARVWDVQIAEYIISHFTHRYPSLDEVCERYGLPKKLDVTKLEYWDKGIQTDEIPWDVLREYAALDASLTLQCYHKQIGLMSPAQVMLCKLMCQDLSILREMEANGLPFDEDLCKKRSEELDTKIQQINTELSKYYPHLSLNFNSGDQLSSFLYGGTVYEESKEHVGFYKTGAKAGEPKFKNVVIEHQLPRLYTPLKGSEMAKAGKWATDEGTLRKLKGKGSTVALLLELAKLEKLNGTYYKGLIKLREEMQWPKGRLHGNYGQTGTVTGRLNSSKPNLQNMAGDIQEVLVSKYSD